MQVMRWVTATVAAVLLVGCGAGERDAAPEERDFEIAVGEVVGIPVVGTNNSARTRPEVVEVTGDAVSHELRVGRCVKQQPGCTHPTTLKVTGVKTGTTTLTVRACFFGNGPKECQQIGEPVIYTVAVR